MQALGVPRLYRNGAKKREKHEKSGEMLKYGVVLDLSLLIVFSGELALNSQFVERCLIGQEHFLIAAHQAAFFKETAFSDPFHIHQKHAGIEIIVLEDISEKPFSVSVGDTGDLKVLNADGIEIF